MSTFVELAAESKTLAHRPAKPKLQLIRGPRDAELAYWSAEAEEATQAGREVNIDAARDTLLGAESSMREYYVRNYTGETLVVSMMAKLGRVDLRRCGSALLAWRSADHKQSQTLLWTALDRSEGGDLSKPVAGDVLEHIYSAGLCEQAVAEKPDQLRSTLAKALGGLGLEEGLVTIVDHSRIRAIVATAAALAPLSIAEQLAVYNADPYSIHISMAARLVRIENSKEQFSSDEWLHNLQMVNRYLESDQRVAVLTGLIATMKPYIVAAIDAQGGWGEHLTSLFAPSDADKLDVALTLLDDAPTAPRWEWINRLWAQTRTAPSVKAAAATLHQHPELVGLVGAVDVDADNDHNHTLVAAANRAAQTLTAEQWLEGHNQRHGGEVAALLTRWPLHPNLVTWLLAGDEIRICYWAKKHYDANLPTVEKASTLAATLVSASRGSALWDNRTTMAEGIYRAILVNTPGVPDYVYRYGRKHGQENLVEDTVNVFGEKFGENVAKWAQLDALMNDGSFDRDSTIAQTLAVLG